jgi:hypothetical protein
VSLQPAKRYLVYDYLQGQVVKEISALRGSVFSCVVCPKALQFDLSTNPEIVIYNQSVVRRVDILTFEIKKNIDLSRLKLPVQPAVSFPASLVQKKLHAPQSFSLKKTQQFNYVPADLNIQAIFLMPRLRLSPEERTA